MDRSAGIENSPRVKAAHAPQKCLHSKRVSASLLGCMQVILAAPRVDLLIPPHPIPIFSLACYKETRYQ